jgi:hypothetical protein
LLRELDFKPFQELFVCPFKSLYLIQFKLNYNKVASDASPSMPESLKELPNRIILSAPKKDNMYSLKLMFNSGWRARQDSKAISIEPDFVDGLRFMKIKSQSWSPIELKFGRINHFLR